MYYVQQIFICALLYLANVDHGSLAENSVSIKNESTNLISTVGNILTPLLLKQVERRLLNHTAISDGVVSIEKLDSSIPMNIDTITTNFELKENHKSSNSPIKKLNPTTTVTTTILSPADRVKTDPKLIVNDDKLGKDSARAPQRQLESQLLFNFRNHINVGFPVVRRQSNEGIFGNGDSFDSNQFHLLTLLDEQKSNDDILKVQGISNSRFPETNSIWPFNSQILPLDFRRFPNFDKFQYNGRYSDLHQFIDPSFKTEADFKGKFGIETGSTTGIITDTVRVADRYNNFERQLYRQNNLPSQYRQNLRNNFPNSTKKNQAIYAVNNNRPITPSINNQGYNYPPLAPQLFFPDYPSNAVSPGSITSINSQTFNNDVDNISDVTSSSLISSRRSEDSIIKPTINIEKVITKVPVVESLQDRIELEQLFFPQQDDYTDIRISPDFFKQHILESKI